MPRGVRMSSVLDTPTKAERCARPKTRGWQALVNASRNDEEKAKRLRSELARYMACADRMSARRAARRRPPARRLTPPIPEGMTSVSTAEMVTPRPRSPALRPTEPLPVPMTADQFFDPPAVDRPVEPPRKKKKVPEGTGQPEHAPDPSIPDWSGRTLGELVAAIETLATPWTDRVAALRALRGVTDPLPDAGAAGLCVQLADLRSKIVVEAADAVGALAGRLAAAHAVQLFRAAAAGIAVKKAVMGDARERAMLAALSAQAGADDAWAVAAEIAKGARQERGRQVAVGAVAAWARSAALPAARFAAVAAILGPAAIDKAPPVREASRKLNSALAEGQTKEAVDEIRKLLPEDARQRLAAGSKGNYNAGRQGGPGAMREMMKQRKIAMMKAKKAEMAASGGGDGAVLTEVVNATKKESPAPSKMAGGQ